MQKSRHNTFAIAVTIVLVVAAFGVPPASASMRTTPRTASAIVQATASHPAREVFGFALASSLSDSTIGYPSWNFDLLSTVAYFGLHINNAGGFYNDSYYTTWNSSAVTNLVTLAHQHGTKVVLTAILQDFSASTPSMCAGLSHADATVADTVGEVKAKGVDGVNIDYEGLNGSCGTTDPSWAQHALTTFAQKMRAGLGSGYYLSIDTYASSAADPYGFFDVAGLSAYVDSFFVMAYDLEYSNWSHPPISCSRFCLGPTAPLTGYYYSDASVASQYAGKVGAGKVILGVPYYGRKACVGSAVANAYPTSSVVADSYLDAAGEASYYQVKAGTYVVHRDAHSSGMERWDTWYNTTLNCTRELYWDDTVSLGKKYDLVNADKLRGVGIWNLNYGGGAPELWTALANHFVRCSSVTDVAAPTSPQLSGTSVTFTATSSGCLNPLYEFWVLAPGSTTWKILQPYSTASTYTWNTTGLAPGNYLYTAWARDANSSGINCSSLGCNDSYMAAATYSLTRQPCTSVTDTPSPASPQLAGTTVTFTATSVGCPHPLYQFWILKAGSTTWQVVQPYSTSNTYAWNTAGLAAGAYMYTAWVRDASSAGIQCSSLGCNDAYFAAQTFKVGSPCSSVSVSASPASPQLSGTAVAFSATSSACLHPLYQFWILPPGSTTWRVAQPWSTSSTYTWNTTGLAPGSYLYTVWAKDSTSPGLHCSYLGCNDAFMVASAYNLTRQPCTSVSETASPAGGAARGTAVTFTATASGCPHPLYQFWILKPGSTTWQVVQAYSTSNTYSWNTSGLPAGSYMYTVWVRDASSTGVKCSYLGCDDAYFPGTTYRLS
jgi:spore germination protein YaaH